MDRPLWRTAVHSRLSRVRLLTSLSIRKEYWPGLPTVAVNLPIGCLTRGMQTDVGRSCRENKINFFSYYFFCVCGHGVVKVSEANLTYRLFLSAS